jgi:type III secretory pathway component EscV
MLDFLTSHRRPESARDLLEQIIKAFPDDREKAKRVFVAAVLDDRRYVRACIEHAFETWTSRTSQ